MRHVWRDLTFLHWPVSVESFRPLIPSGLRIDTFEGQAWLGIIPFWMSFRLRNLPGVPWVSTFAEINVRTYVRLDDVPGVWFLSLDCSNCFVANIARAWYGLRYFSARTVVEPGDTGVRYLSRRSNTEQLARFEASCKPNKDSFQSKPGTLTHWLTERYHLYALNWRGHLLRAQVHHEPWILHDAEVSLNTNTMADAHGITLPTVRPLVHFARHTDVLVWAPEKVNSPA